MPAKHARLTQTLIAGLAIACMIASPADARRGGSFGSRGSRTFYAPRQTSMMPQSVAPLQRSMTQPSANGMAPIGSPWRSQNAYGQSYPQPRQASRFGGFGGGLIGGLVAGGLLGSLLGHGGGGWGSGGGGMGGGFLISLIQLLILGGGIWFVIRLFRRNAKPAVGGFSRANAGLQGSTVSPFSNTQPVQPVFGGNYSAPSPAGFGTPSQAMNDIALSDSDRATFEHLLIEVQDAFGHEDYSRLRAVTTPEIMSYLSEELSQNATSGRRNDVTGTRLIDAEVSEAWREDNAEYATIAMRYASIDVMRDRATGAIVEGDPQTPTETSEVWTFTRPPAGSWKLSAIQE